MLSERYRPQTWGDFVGQPIIDEIIEACGDSWLFDDCGERWLYESDGIAGCGKTSAAYVTARALGCGDFAIDRIDSRACTVADLRELSSKMMQYGWGGDGRRCYIIDEIQHLNRDCQRMLLGILENLPSHVIVIGTTTSIDWADEVDGLFSRWRRFRFRKPSAPAVAEHLERIAREVGLPIPDGFRFLSYVQGKCGVQLRGNNVRDCIDQLPDTLRRYKGAERTAKSGKAQAA
ncbi:MAG: AAA family ATPase [Planctomycetota bacterium]|jgi:replication-associated recombination protein RarA